MSDEGAERGEDVLNEGEEAKEEEGKQARLQLVGFHGFMLSQDSRRVLVQAHRATLLRDDTRERRHCIQRWV